MKQSEIMSPGVIKYEEHNVIYEIILPRILSFNQDLVLC